MVFFFSIQEIFVGGLVAIEEKNQLDKWPLKGVGWGLAVCEIVPVVFGDNSFWEVASLRVPFQWG